ncbi:MAG: hypothetical protein DWB56_16880 [Candidatus Jettenia sp.]|uniref:Uncharacterized protein n=1 Tax=Candidatus Jettenia caeni TaxID=247490 RepID=I3IN29_9BACT|nr:MAG: hypothetical protein EDM77_16810 [Candidatus Jettenia sp. AMX1]MBC6930592.1 hypothetical protein [Candidatus Jettenia sp.]NUN24252.1 hypothetical protein [Candidatus Jettenia caeni]GAB62176.1 hypothetical protein KSU1_C0580 [Candidatus Jettenia caeni]GAB63124.1 hypothetical protein KSU1_C1528 [Candidatus Jettenia caeni]
MNIVKAAVEFAKKYYFTLVLMLAVMFTAAKSSFAALDLTSVTIDTSDVFKVAAIVLTALGAIWGIKLVIGMFKNR